MNNKNIFIYQIYLGYFVNIIYCKLKIKCDFIIVKNNSILILYHFKLLFELQFFSHYLDFIQSPW